MGISSNKKPLPVLRSETPASDTEKIIKKENVKKKRKEKKRKSKRIKQWKKEEERRKPVIKNIPSSGVVFTFEERISTSHICLKGQQPYF